VQRVSRVALRTWVICPRMGFELLVGCTQYVSELGFEFWLGLASSRFLALVSPLAQHVKLLPLGLTKGLLGKISRRYVSE